MRIRYEEIDPGMYPSDMADCLEDLANEVEMGAGELDCKDKTDTAKIYRKMSKILYQAADKLRKLM